MRKLSRKRVSINKKSKKQSGGVRYIKDMVSIDKKKGVEIGIIKKIKKKSKTNKNNWSPNNKSCGWFSYNGKPTYIGCPG